MSKGGQRPNAGRPSARRTLAYDRLLEGHSERLKQYGLLVPPQLQHLTPLDAMLYLMKIAVDQRDHKFALECAKQCAGYLHPRLSMAMISHTSETQRPDTLSDTQLQDLIFEATALLQERQTPQQLQFDHIAIDAEDDDADDPLPNPRPH